MSSATEAFEIHRAMYSGRGWVVWLVGRRGTLSWRRRVDWFGTKEQAERYVARMNGTYEQKGVVPPATGGV